MDLVAGSAGGQGPFRIRLQHQDFVVIDKPPGYLVHRSSLDPACTALVLQALRTQMGQRLYPVHRLDRPTSGLLVLARSQEAAGELGALIRSQQLSKQYHVLCRGFLAADQSIVAPLEHPRSGRLQPCSTSLRLLRRFELPHGTGSFASSRYSLLQVATRNGRSHQIRRHLKLVSHPIIGDTKYGKGEHNRLFRRLGWGRLMLHASQLSFPWGGEQITVGSHEEPRRWQLGLERLSVLAGEEAHHDRRPD